MLSDDLKTVLLGFIVGFAWLALISVVMMELLSGCTMPITYLDVDGDGAHDLIDETNQIDEKNDVNFSLLKSLL